MISTRSMRIAVQDTAARLGVFEDVSLHEPKNAPNTGITMAIWGQARDPLPALSGLDVTSYRVELTARQYDNMKAEPQDDIDIDMEDAADLFFDALSTGFTLGGTVFEVDLLGTYGAALGWRSGYLTIDNHMYRVIDHTLPLIFADVQPQEA